MRHLTQKFHWRFRIAVFQFSICRTHAAHRMNTTLHALRGRMGPLFLTYFDQKLIPTLAHTSAANVVCVLMRENANTHLAIRVDGKTLNATTAAVHGAVDVGRWTVQFTVQVFAVLGSELFPVHIKCYYFFG